MSGTEPISLAALVSHPIQYQAPLFRAIDDVDGVDLTVYFCDDRGVEPTVDPGFGEEIVWDQPLLEGYDHEFLENWPDRTGADIVGDVNPEVISALREADHDALWVHGYASVTNWLALFTAKAIGLPVLFRGESTLLDQPPTHLPPVKYAAIRTLRSLVDAYGVIGSRNRDFYRAHGIPEERLFDAPYTVHNAYFQRAREELAPQSRLRQRIGIPDRPTVLFVGKLVRRKRPKTLLKAFVSSTDPGEATLVYVGDGEQREDLERWATALERSEDVFFAGFQNQTELPTFYEAADVFILPSERENWGLVVNEAMNFGLPIVTTEVVGAAADLVDESNGVVVPPADSQELARAIRNTLDSDYRRMGERSLERISGWGIDETVSGLLVAANFVCESSESR